MNRLPGGNIVPARAGGDGGGATVPASAGGAIVPTAGAAALPEPRRDGQDVKDRIHLLLKNKKRRAKVKLKVKLK